MPLVELYKSPTFESNPLLAGIENRTIEQGSDDAIIWLEEKSEQHLTYSQLFCRALSVGRLLIRRDLTQGERVVLCYFPGPAFLEAFLGCVATGIVPVPVYPPSPGGGSCDAERFRVILAICKARFVLTDKWYWRVACSIPSLWGAASWIKTDNVQDQNLSPSCAEWAVVDPDDVCFVQFTSGSTAEPKGVKVTHNK
ncbi:MAG: uncharacterized protein KVP18_004723 [Porospora cf. gigantea A]|uniref:uncharacterized protein n=1 Tax=Porospora cf. gigantea A TaxID=2853593 RepID=UPI00355A2134|nr:MAG: hypothetical protein KVP18_004723 [Porospora cf. gigantea A]